MTQIHCFAEKSITLYFMAVIAKSLSFLRKIRPVPFNSSGVPIRLPSRLHRHCDDHFTANEMIISPAMKCFSGIENTDFPSFRIVRQPGGFWNFD